MRAKTNLVNMYAATKMVWGPFSSFQQLVPRTHIGSGGCRERACGKIQQEMLLLVFFGFRAGLVNLQLKEWSAKTIGFVRFWGSQGADLCQNHWFCKDFGVPEGGIVEKALVL